MVMRKRARNAQDATRRNVTASVTRIQTLTDRIARLEKKVQTLSVALAALAKTV